MTPADHDTFQTLIDDRRESFAEWLSLADLKKSHGGKHDSVLNTLELALKRIREGSDLCRACPGKLERELLAALPDSRICLDCLADSEKRRLEMDLQQAQEINLSLLSRAIPRTRAWEIGVYSEPSRILSGDFFDLIVQPDTRTMTLVVGDVAGKGIPAGLLRASLQATLRVLGGTSSSPAELLAEANQHFLPLSHPARFASVFYGVFSEDHDSLLYSNGGHLPPLLRRAATGRWEALNSTGPVLGILEGSSYEERSCAIDTGDLLVLYSDGITETEDLHGEFFDEERLVSCVDRLRERPVQEIVDALAAELNRFSSGAAGDDRTLVILRSRS